MEVINYVKELIAISKSDLRASEILHAHECYPQSYFFFQQTVEKANKAFALMEGIISIEELHALGHDQIKIYKKSCRGSREKNKGTRSYYRTL